jgi:hypothetical protein
MPFALPFCPLPFALGRGYFCIDMTNAGNTITRAVKQKEAKRSKKTNF